MVAGDQGDGHQRHGDTGKGAQAGPLAQQQAGPDRDDRRAERAGGSHDAHRTASERPQDQHQSQAAEEAGCGSQSQVPVGEAGRAEQRDSDQEHQEATDLRTERDGLRGAPASSEPTPDQ